MSTDNQGSLISSLGAPNETTQTDWKVGGGVSLTLSIYFTYILGHPLCEYCDQRFFDRDELYKHYRKEHFFCHLCDHDGHEEYYSDYSQLRQHFLKTHYLCELDDCSKNAAQTHEYVVFRSELDFQAHKKQKHAKHIVCICET